MSMPWEHKPAMRNTLFASYDISNDGSTVQGNKIWHVHRVCVNVWLSVAVFAVQTGSGVEAKQPSLCLEPNAWLGAGAAVRRGPPFGSSCLLSYQVSVLHQKVGQTGQSLLQTGHCCWPIRCCMATKPCRMFMVPAMLCMTRILQYSIRASEHLPTAWL